MHLTAYRTQRVFFTKLSFLIPVLIIVAMIYMFFDWRLGLVLVVSLLLLEIASVKLAEHYVKKKDIACGTYIDRKAIVWCKTCKHFRKIAPYESSVSTAASIPRTQDLPCEIVDQSLGTWTAFYLLPIPQRTLYPKGCELWVRR